MLLPLIARAAEHDIRSPTDYERWSAALQELRAALAGNPGFAPGELPELVVGLAPDVARDALADLVAEHMRHAWRAGRRAVLEDYVTALAPCCPDFAALRTVPAELVEDEWIVRHTLPGGDMPQLEEYARRFAGRSDVLALIAGRTFGSGRYVKLRKLGRGALGRVWEACDRRLGRQVAIKEPHPELLDGRTAARFIAEAETAMRLDHPGIVRVHEIMRDGAHAPWFVMDLVRGTSLAEEIRRLHHPEAIRTRRETDHLRRKLLRSVVAIARATAHAHARGVLHRDLKPGNVLIGEAGDAVIVDWGAAASTGISGPAFDGADGLAGTPESMAPEQALGFADERSDVFGLGAILYEVLTGSSVHAWKNGERPADWRSIVAEGRVLATRVRKRGVPRALNRICRRALARDPAERLPSASALADALQRQLDGTRPRLLRLWDTLRLRALRAPCGQATR